MATHTNLLITGLSGARKLTSRLARRVKTRFYENRAQSLGALALVLIILGAGCFALVRSNTAQRLTGTAACITLVKQIEGDKFNSIHSLKCTLEQRKIGNSTLTAQYYSYTGFFKDPDGCVGPIDPGFSPGLPVCPQGDGVILSNGRRYVGLGSREKVDDRPFDYDECYNGTGGIDVLYPPVPTTRDLYFYKGDLWDRDVYRNVPVKTVVGTCFINGTTLTNYAAAGGTTHYTNVVASYPNFPSNCAGVPIGSSGDDYYKCVNLVTAARADLTVCRSGLDIVETKDYKIQSYTQGAPGMPTPWCEASYVQRMAALNRCGEIADVALREKCAPLVYHPYEGTTRIFGDI